MAQLIKNSTPMNIPLGTDDQSGVLVFPESIPVSQFLNKAFVFAKRGPAKAEPAVGGKLIQLYSGDTFNPDLKYYNHSTRFLNAIAATGATNMVQRVIPTDAIKANVIVYLDIVETDIPNYDRNANGDYALDAQGDKIVNATTATIRGHKYKLITDYVTDNTDIETLSTAAGTLAGVDAVGDPVVSVRYPIFAYNASEAGEDYNNSGFIFDTVKVDDIDSALLTDSKTMPFNISLVTRPNAKTTPTLVKTFASESALQFTLANKAVHPTTRRRMDLETIIATSWSNTSNRLLPLRYSDFGTFKVYRDNIKIIADKIMLLEAPLVTEVAQTWADGSDATTYSWYDYSTSDDTAMLATETLLINLFTGKSTKNIDYLTFVDSEDAPTLTGNLKEIKFGKNTPIYLNGGTDGTLDDATFESLVVAEMAKYADDQSEFMDTAINTESVMVDSGYSKETKLELCNFISIRKDTILMLSTFESKNGEKDTSIVEQRSIAIALKTRLGLMAESEYFGTGVMRAIIVAGTGMSKNPNERDRIPLTYSIAVKSAIMMGKPEWDAEKKFDYGSIITELVDISPGNISNGLKPVLRDDGIVYAQPYDRETFQFPDIQTVYSDETSVLNNWWVICAIATLNKIAQHTWRKHTGATGLTEAEFGELILNDVNLAIKDKFASMFTIVPNVVFTAADKDRGYSWHLIMKIYASGSKTVMVSNVEAHRISDL